MKKWCFIALFFCLGQQLLHSQNNYFYYYQDKKIPVV